MRTMQSWDEAKAYCNALGARLMEIHSEEDLERAMRFRQEMGGNFVVGGRKIDGVWIWESNGDEINEFWQHGRPLGWDDTNCAVVTLNAIYDWRCTVLYRAVCEYD